LQPVPTLVSLELFFDTDNGGGRFLRNVEKGEFSSVKKLGINVNENKGLYGTEEPTSRILTSIHGLWYERFSDVTSIHGLWYERCSDGS
jgi:hypothetical protein